ncbi:hypothetical protein F2P56_035140 [Juglans regia]|nr:hypothetical protein F2P56_035140 [Juglans regia]
MREKWRESKNKLRRTPDSFPLIVSWSVVAVVAFFTGPKAHWSLSEEPENLLLTTEGHVKIVDFGSVKPMQESRIIVPPNAASDDKACTFVGTVAYVPPEVLNSSPATFG